MKNEKKYKVKEIYYTVQGEGFHTGRPAIFCRFSGCNLWSGREQDRDKAICKFCDTDFWGTDGVNGGKYTAQELIQHIISMCPSGTLRPMVVLTGGEPALQLDEQLLSEFHKNDFYVAIETNGTMELPDHIDWICVSPKASEELVVTLGDELKLVYPQEENHPAYFDRLEFNHFYLQPMDGPHQDENIALVVEFCLKNPKWKVSLQTHKFIGID